MRTNRFRGFTLIELLVVIAIIAILAAILFPVFAQAREKARQTTCLSNEKQIGDAILMYNEDYDEVYVPAAEWKKGPNADWTSLVQPYIKSGSWAGWITDGGVFQCPSYPGIQSTADGPSGAPGGQYVPRGDVFVTYDTPSDGANFLPNPVNEAQIPDPAGLIGFWEVGANGSTGATYGWGWNFSGNNTYGADTDGAVWVSTSGNYQSLNSNKLLGNCDLSAGNFSWGGGGVPTATNGVGCLQFPRYRHTNVSNIWYLDGHVKGMQLGRLNYTNDVFIPGVCWANVYSGATAPPACPTASPVAPY